MSDRQRLASAGQFGSRPRIATRDVAFDVFRSGVINALRPQLTVDGHEVWEIVASVTGPAPACGGAAVAAVQDAIEGDLWDYLDVPEASAHDTPIREYHEPVSPW